MIFYDEKLSMKNRSPIYGVDHENSSMEILEFKKRSVGKDKVCYVIIARQGDKYYMLGAKYLERFIGFEISEGDKNIIKDYFKTYEIERAIRLGSDF